jgi:hypothetical protein
MVYHIDCLSKANLEFVNGGARDAEGNVLNNSAPAILFVHEDDGALTTIGYKHAKRALRHRRKLLGVEHYFQAQRDAWSDNGVGNGAIPGRNVLLPV